jgi:uncharacterized membrane protein YkvA (DUF1232 family)
MPANLESGAFVMGDPGFDYYKQLSREVRIWQDGQGKDFPYNHFVAQAPELFHLLTKMVQDGAVTEDDRTKLLGAVIYFVSPIDVLPERVAGGAGYLDDVALAAYVLKGLSPEASNGALSGQWDGDGDVSALIDDILGSAESMVGKEIWAKIKAKVDGW